MDEIIKNKNVFIQYDPNTLKIFQVYYLTLIIYLRRTNQSEIVGNEGLRD